MNEGMNAPLTLWHFTFAFQSDTRTATNSLLPVQSSKVRIDLLRRSLIWECKEPIKRPGHGGTLQVIISFTQAVCLVSGTEGWGELHRKEKNRFLM